MQKSYLSEKIILKDSSVGKSLFAKQPISKDETVIDYSSGKGKMVEKKIADELFDIGQDYQIQVADNKFFSAVTEEEIEEADFLNHSCDPTCGISGSLRVVAMRDISPGEEITIDYAMTESSSFEIVCKCRSRNCRGQISGEDWQNQELQEKYLSYFSDYLKKKVAIDTTKHGAVK